MLTCANIKKRKKELLLAFAYILTAEEGFVNRGTKIFAGPIFLLEVSKRFQACLCSPHPRLY